MKPIYLDYAATTPIDPEVAKKIESIPQKEGDYFGNPGSLHYFGQKAQSIIDFSRQEIAKTIWANFFEIVFTSSATEANNLVLRGVLKSFFKKQKGCHKIPKFIVSSIEHPSVLETAKILEKDGAVKVTYLPVDLSGVVDLSVLEKELDKDTILVSVMWVNNETGAIQPIEKISSLIEKFKEENKKELFGSYPLFHTDATQAFSVLDLNTAKTQVDLMTFSSHKIYGPRGAAALYIRGGADKADFIEPIISGGDQEYGLRSGTENVQAIAGFAYAARKVSLERKNEFARLNKLAKSFFEKLKSKIDTIEINGSWDKKAPHILNLYFPQKENLVIALDMAGVAASSGSACSQRYQKPSYVLLEMGLGQQRAKESVRFSFGRFTTQKDIDQAVERIIIALRKN
jgi:cysteine desulfurase